MATQYIVNDSGKKTAVIIPIEEYERLLQNENAALEFTEEYKAMIDVMLVNEDQAKYLSAEDIKKRFQR